MAHTPQNSWPKATLILLGLLAVSLYMLQYWTLPKYAALPQNIISLKVFWSAVSYLVKPGWQDAIFFLLPALLFVGIIALEARRREFSNLLIRCCTSDRATCYLLAASAIVITRYYFAMGEINWAGDGSAHIAFAYAAIECIAAGEIPIWTNLISLGSPYLQYYGFLYFYLVGLLDLFVGSMFTTIKISLALGHIASIFGMYMLARVAGRSRAAGVLGALAYGLCFWHLQQVLIMGRYPLCLFYAVLPWPFYFFERLRLPARRVAAVCGGGLTLGILPFIHPGYGFWATLFFSFYGLVRILHTPHFRSREIIIAATLLAGGAVLFGAYLTVPMWLERAGTGIDSGVILSGVPDPSWKRVFIWSNLRFPLWPLTEKELPWYGGYLGIVPFGLACIGAILPWRLPARGRHLPHLAVACCFALSLILVFGYRLPALQALPFVTALNAGRYLLFTTFFMSLAAGIGGAALRHRWPSDVQLRTLSLPILLVVLDLGPTTIQQPYQPHGYNPTMYSEDLLQELQQKGTDLDLSAGEIPNFRIFSNLDKMHPFVANTWLAYHTRLPSPQADHRLLMPSMHAFAAPFERYIDFLLNHPDSPPLQQSHTVLSGLQLLNIHHLVNVNSSREIAALMNATTSPALVSSRIEDHAMLAADSKSENGQHIAAYIDAMDINLGRKISARFFIADLVATHDLDTDPSLEVTSHRVWHQRVELDLRVTAPCYTRLAYTYFPALEVLVNNRPVEPLRTAAGFICLPLETGPNKIVLQARLSPLRQVLLGIDLVLLAIGFGAFIRSKKNGASLSTRYE
jgi:hypothetical protein